MTASVDTVGTPRPAAPSPAVAESQVPAATPLVEVRDLVKHFAVRGGVLQRTARSALRRRLRLAGPTGTAIARLVLVAALSVFAVAVAHRFSFHYSPARPAAGATNLIKLRHRSANRGKTAAFREFGLAIARGAG